MDKSTIEERLLSILDAEIGAAIDERSQAIQMENWELANDISQFTLDLMYAAKCYAIEIIQERDSLRKKITAPPLSALIGMEVSVDVSTGEDDLERRYFGTVIGTNPGDGKHGAILLVADCEANF